MKFEEVWSTIRMKQSVDGWYWDSMQAAHILDNRPGITGLKFQTYVNFGIIDYSSSIEPYLSGDGSNGFNRTQEILEDIQKRNDLLLYCGLDSIYEFRLAMKQMDLINPDNLPF
jgi:hypothetical protein